MTPPCTFCFGVPTIFKLLMEVPEFAAFDASRVRWFISGGVNVYPAEIEAELLLHPQVRDAAVIAVSHPTWGEVGVAFVSTNSEPPRSHRGIGRLSPRPAGRLQGSALPTKLYCWLILSPLGSKITRS